MYKGKQRGEHTERLHQQSEDTLKHVRQQIESIDSLIVDLLCNVDFDELKSKERIDLVIKLMSQQTRLLILRQSCADELPGSKDEQFVSALMRRMRGEEHFAESVEGE